MRFDGKVKEANRLFIQIAERFPYWEDTLDDEVRAYDAAGNLPRAREVLEHGVRIGHMPCLRMFWLQLVSNPEWLGPLKADVVADAFDKSFEDMKRGLHDRDAFARIAIALRSVELFDRAARIDAHVAKAFSPEPSDSAQHSPERR